MNTAWVLLIVWTSWGGIETQKIEVENVELCKAAIRIVVDEYNNTANRETFAQGYCIRTQK